MTTTITITITIIITVTNYCHSCELKVRANPVGLTQAVLRNRGR